MLDVSRLVKPEREVITDALEALVRAESRTAERAKSAKRRGDATARVFVARELLREIRLWR